MSTLGTLTLSLKRQGQVICQNANFLFQAGECWGILGPNGAGKSTLLHALAGFDPIASKHIYLNEKKLTEWSAKTRAQKLGILFQESHFPFSQTVWEFCAASRFPHRAYFAKDSKSENDLITQALQTMELLTLRARDVTQLSGGEKRRLEIAALLIQAPDIYLLDEPANHLDLKYKHSVLQHFKLLTQTQSATVIMSLHDINHAVQFCNRVMMIFPNGEILQGTPETLLTEGNLSRLYQYPMQAIKQHSMTYWHSQY